MRSPEGYPQTYGSHGYRSILPVQESRNVGMAYLLLVLPMFCMIAGLHRFYLNRPVSGLLYLLTFGLFGMGTIVDLFLLPKMVEEENMRIGDINRWRSLAGSTAQHGSVPTMSVEASSEQAILRLARDNQGRVTVTMVALETGLSLRRAKLQLERLCKDGYAERDVTMEGATLYVFQGLISNQPFDIDSI